MIESSATKVIEKVSVATAGKRIEKTEFIYEDRRHYNQGFTPGRAIFMSDNEPFVTPLS
jgi:hypothetical protein